MKNDALTMTLLFDTYGELLTQKQRTCFDLYYNQDFSLAEIAEQVGISRQGVHDSLARAEVALTDMEKITGCVKKAAVLRKALSVMEPCLMTLAGSSDEETKRCAAQLAVAVHTLRE